MIKPDFMPIAIGSFPHESADEAFKVIFKYFKDIPLWPQLPKVSFKEHMYLQYSKGLPGLAINSINNTYYIQYDDAIYEKIAEFFEKSFEGNPEDYAMEEDAAAGFAEFMKRKKEIKNLNPKAVKGHITGPVSLALGILDQNKKPVIYHEEYFDAINQLIIKKSEYQIKKLKEINDNVIYFLDEPYLSSLGSGMLNLDKEKIKENLKNVIAKIKDFGVTLGIHCCGNTDWSLIMDLGADIISFDAYNYGEDLLQFSEELKIFMGKGGMLAWGIVPSTKDFEKITFDALIQKLYALFGILVGRGFNIKEVLRKSFVSPSCGMGSLDEPLTENIAKTTMEVSSHIKKEYGV